MKNIILAISLLTSSVYADLSMDQIRTMVKKIHDKREGISLDTLSQTKEPFVRLEAENNTTKYVVESTQRAKKLSLHGIMNERAYINNKWRDVDDIIEGFELKYIGQSGVVLRNNKEIKKLFFDKRKENFITIVEKGIK